MRKITTAAFVSSILIAGALPAVAADLPVKARPMAPVAMAYNWTGCYIGGNVGGKWVRTSGSVDIGPTGTGVGSRRAGFSSLCRGGHLHADFWRPGRL